MIFKTTYPSSVIRPAVLVVTHALSSLKSVIGCDFISVDTNVFSYKMCPVFGLLPYINI